MFKSAEIRITFFVVNSECLLQLFLERLLILLDQELCGQLTKLAKLQKSGSVLVNLLDDFLQS
jgi:hypothetical protein